MARWLDLSFDHHRSQFGDCLRGVEALGTGLGTGLGTVHDGVTAIKPERIFECIQALAGRFVAAVFDPARRLQQRGWTEEALAVPPIARTRSRAARAQ
jgi:hypothetical protein